MNKRNYFKKNKYIYFTLFFLCLINVSKESCGESPRGSDVASIQWENRVDVQKAANDLAEMHRLFEDVVQGIYNSYASHAIGSGVTMLDRKKELARLINALKHYEKIKFKYTQLIGSKRPFEIKIKEIKKIVRFHYFQSESKEFDFEGHTIISEVGFALENLFKDPNFSEVTKIKFDRIEDIKKALYAALHNAMEVVPGGMSALQN